MNNGQSISLCPFDYARLFWSFHYAGAEVKGTCTEAGMYALRERRVHVTQVGGPLLLNTLNVLRFISLYFPSFIKATDRLPIVMYRRSRARPRQRVHCLHPIDRRISNWRWLRSCRKIRRRIWASRSSGSRRRNLNWILHCDISRGCLCRSLSWRCKEET